MKILVFAHDSSLYGASQSLLTLLYELKKKNELLILLPYPGKIEQILKNNNLNYSIIRYPRAVVNKNEIQSFRKKIKSVISFYKNTYKAMPLVKAVCKSFKPDIIYTNTSVITIGYKMSRVYKIPHVWHVREFGEADFNLQYFPSKKRVAAMIRNSRKAVFVCNAVSQSWLPDTVINSEVILHGILSKKEIYSTKTYPTNTIKIGIIGAVSKGKGQDIAIGGFQIFNKQFSNSILKIYGDGVDYNFYNELKLYCKKNDLMNCIYFEQFEENKDLIYNELDVVLNCSVMECLGRTITEAMARGIPVIANGSGGTPEIIKNQYNGLLYNKSCESLGEQMISLFSNKTIYENISLNGFISCRQNFNIEKYTSSMSVIFDNIHNEKLA